MRRVGRGPGDGRSRSCRRSLLGLLLGLQSLLLFLRKLGSLMRETRSAAIRAGGQQEAGERERTSSLDFLLFFFGVSSAAPSAAISDLRFCNAGSTKTNVVSNRSSLTLRGK